MHQNFRNYRDLLNKIVIYTAPPIYNQLPANLSDLKTDEIFMKVPCSFSERDSEEFINF